MRLVIEAVVAPPFETNVYLVGDADAGEAVVVDPGGRASEIVSLADRCAVEITCIVATHAHVDHVAGAADLAARTGAPFRLHRAAADMLPTLVDQARMFGLPAPTPPRCDGLIAAGDTIRVGELALAVRDTPGHAPGHIALVGPRIDHEGRSVPFALCGDAVFQGSIGRTDLSGGDYATLLRSIEAEILSLPDETMLLPGHGPATSVGRERGSNPFLLDWLVRGRGGMHGR